MTRRRSAKQHYKSKSRPTKSRLLHALGPHVLAALGVIVVIATVLRFWNITHLGLTHWDEGDYTLSALKLTTSDSGYWNWLNTPPLYPVMAMFAYKLFGVSDWISIAVSALFGVLTVPLCFSLGKQLFNPQVGLSAAAFLAVCEYHLIYSRMALLDALVVFFYLVTFVLIALAWEKRSLWLYLAAGVSGAAVLLTKYSGPVIFAIVGLSLAFSILQDAFRCRFDLKHLWQMYRLRLLGVFIAGGVALLLFVPWLLIVERELGVLELWQHIMGYSVGGGLTVKTPPFLIYQWFAHWTSLPLMTLGLVGFLISLAKRTSADVFCLTYFGVYTGLLMLYTPYPRLALPLIPLLCIWAGRGLVFIGKRLQTMKLRSKPYSYRVSRWVVAFLLLITLVSEGVDLPRMLAMKTVGYRQASAVVNRLQIRTQALVCFDLQDNVLFYHLYAYSLYTCLNNQQIHSILTSNREKYFVFDQTVFQRSWSKKFFTDNRNQLQVVEKIPNPLYEILFLQAGGLERFSLLENPPDEYKYITIYKLESSAIFP